MRKILEYHDGSRSNLTLSDDDRLVLVLVLVLVMVYAGLGWFFSA
jgi:hypothetical protein